MAAAAVSPAEDRRRGDSRVALPGMPLCGRLPWKIRMAPSEDRGQVAPQTETGRRGAAPHSSQSIGSTEMNRTQARRNAPTLGSLS